MPSMERPRGSNSPTRASLPPLMLVLVLVLTGCGADVERQQAGAAADAFTTEAQVSPKAACALLAPNTLKSLQQDGAACDSALRAQNLPGPGTRTGIVVAGHSAQVRYVQQTVFLSLFDQGWKVIAAGCTRSSSDPSVPYDCLVEGN